MKQIKMQNAGQPKNGDNEAPAVNPELASMKVNHPAIGRGTLYEAIEGLEQIHDMEYKPLWFFRLLDHCQRMFGSFLGAAGELENIGSVWRRLKQTGFEQGRADLTPLLEEVLQLSIYFIEDRELNRFEKAFDGVWDAIEARHDVYDYAETRLREIRRELEELSPKRKLRGQTKKGRA